MYQQRHNEKTFQLSGKSPRNARGYEINGQWYFELRGGGQKGPYDSKLKMQADLDEFIKFNNEMNSKY